MQAIGFDKPAAMGYNGASYKKGGILMKKSRIWRCFLLVTLFLFLVQLPCAALATEAESPVQEAAPEEISIGGEDGESGETLALSSPDDYLTQGKAGLESYWLEPDFAEGDYTMVVLPDTQFMVGYYAKSYYSMMQWIADNRDTLNIQAVMHMGDMVNKNNATEWTAFKTGTDILDEAGIPWMPMMGNHDDSQMLKRYFDYQTYGPGRSWFGGSYHADQLDYTYWFVTVGDREYMILSLGWIPDWDVLDWAKGIVEAYPNKNVIINCHAYMNDDGTLICSGKDHSIGVENPGYPEGDDIWEAFQDYENVVLAMSGHVGCPDIISRVDQNGGGNDVHSMLINNQSDGISNATGMIAVLTFHADSNAVDVNWYSTKLDAMYGPKNQFSINVSHVNSGDTESEDITERFGDWTTGGAVRYGDGIAYGEAGYTEKADNQLMYSGFIPIAGYERLELTLCARKGYTATGGFAFYSDDDPAAFISHGADARNGNGEKAEGTVVRSVAVPEGAKYIRVTYWSDSSSYAEVPFQCVGYKTTPDCEHVFQTTVVAPTCSEQGYAARLCSLCGRQYRDDYTPALGHHYGAWYTLTEATCLAVGEESRECDRCGHSENRVVDALGHSFTTVITAPTCTEPGYSTLVCDRCGYAERETGMVDITDQFLWTVGTAIQATTGKQVADGNWQSSNYVDISGYDTIEIVTANTAASTTVYGIAFYDSNKNYVSGIRHTDGSGVYGTLLRVIDVPDNVVYIRTTWYSANNGNYKPYFGSFSCMTKDDMYLEATGHTPGEAVVEDNDNHGTYVLVTYCASCGEELERKTVVEEITPHTYTGQAVPPTCNEEGYTVYTCIYCDHSYTERDAAPLGHAYEDGHCIRCGRPEHYPGDVNGDDVVDARDAYWIVLFYKERIRLTDLQLTLADVDGNGIVDTRDACWILLYSNGKIEHFPA